MTMKKAYLVLENGRALQGYRFGADSDAVGELVFHTGVVGYVETLTDPSYAGQIVMQTYPLIGNYGIMEEDFEGKCAARGYVVREWCDVPSNFRTQYDLDTFLKNQGVPGLYGVDTRELTRILREEGTMNAAICDEIPADLTALKDYRVRDAVKSVTGTSLTVCPAEGEERFRVSLVDCGVKRSLIRGLQAMGCTVTVLPASVTAEEILADGPDGVVLSAGPGDPAENAFLAEQVKKLLGKKPVFGVGLGHQLMALAAGGRTEKLKCGHHGGNQPSRDLVTGRTHITSQNNNYTVTPGSVPGGVVRFVNANDGAWEGIDYPELRAFSVQFDPVLSSGSRDANLLFDRFADLMKGGAL
ncbi:glutamine-hydrolyzing carbamoyl-phosphate synthase small subunit [Dysosmobacter sp.]|uniref:glutamine-hydrolyzing carbamoyl-phosphate synthase small subunit n=1 Tax=Dysosmobacter sp. TaxID=2591382 RepID=UPI002A881F46|nr:glutamine-hydrolyzing carbamoyl-phosphate synthase small subunit [Dysosmobacter sp.]MDY3282256.1 glutamine-hydrolyzing carbamoyl-phosphate synthase small subunit [Dysosmobacter sp.]